MNKKQEKIVLSIIMSIVFMVVIYYTVGEREFNNWKDSKDKNKELTAKIEEAQNLQARLTREIQHFAKYTNTLFKINSKVVSDGNFVDFVSIVKQAIDKSGTKILNIRPVQRRDDIVRAAGYIERLVEFEVAESYHDIGNLLDYLVSTNTYVRVAELELKTNKGQKHQTKITLGFLVKRN